MQTLGLSFALFFLLACDASVLVNARTLLNQQWQHQRSSTRQLQQTAGSTLQSFDRLWSAGSSSRLRQWQGPMPEPAQKLLPRMNFGMSKIQPVKPFAALASVLTAVNSKIPDAKHNKRVSSADEGASAQHQQKAFPAGSALLQSDGAADGLADMQADDSTIPITAGDSSASAVGLAFNGGKASAKASANAQNAGSSAALANAIAIADRTAAATSKAAAHASNPADTGMSIAMTTSSAVGDSSSVVVSRGGSLSIGLGGDLTAAKTVSEGAATQGAVAYVGGTAVSLAAGAGSTSSTTSHGSAAAEKGAVAATRADSISLGLLKRSSAYGSARANSQATRKGIALSQSLMESFAILAGKSQATSKADAIAAAPGFSRVQDKAVGIGTAGAEAETHTLSAGGAELLGVSVIDSVARSITAGNQRACADAVTTAYSDLSTGPQISLDTFALVLKQRADKQCVSIFKEQALARILTQQVQLPSTESLINTVHNNTAAALEAAAGAADRVIDFVRAPLTLLPDLIHNATVRASKT